MLELGEYVAATSREVSGENFIKFNNDVNKKIFELIHSSDLNDKIGGIMAIDRLIEFDGTALSSP